MRKTKFWLVQILMIAIVGLILGSPALADKPAKAAAKSETGNHGYDMRMQNANMYSGNAEWKQVDDPGDPGDPPAPATCSAATPEACDAQSCFDANGFWFDLDGDGVDACEF